MEPRRQLLLLEVAKRISSTRLEKQPKDGYEDISQKVISYCKGVPLALTVVGASLRSKSKEVWECQMNKLQSIPNMKIQKNLSNLKEINLECSIHLTDIPDLSKATKLECVNLGFCRSLHKLILCNSKLKYLELCECTKLGSLNIHSKCLSKLYLHDLLSLTEISVTSNILTTLTLFTLRKLESLNVNSRSLKELRLSDWPYDLSYCPFLKKISVVSDEITILTLCATSITSLPSSISSLPKLTNLNLSNCRNLLALPELPRSLRLFWLDNCKNLVSLPELPSSLDLLSALNCISLETEMCQRLVLQHLLRSNSYGRDSKYFVFPADHVIKECEFHTKEHSMSIPASSLNISHLCRFIYCIILSKELHYFFGMSVSIYQDDAKLWHTRGPSVGGETLISDHVMFGYHDLSKFDGMSEVLHHSRDVQIIFQLLEEQKGQKGFVVFPVYATTSGFKLQISESQSIQPKQPLHQRGEGLNQKL
ncbi:hypothetical protein Fmac_009414 [Flemingia macrophylla]|uniref:NB-ARC domain-containing protein n=1 Tax=Flemingia macrophylla TaxID=520843 RepID=A0ABD1N093_9FABA